VVQVAGADELRAALGNAAPGSTILVTDGVYELSGGPDLVLGAPGLTLRSASGHRESVVLAGGASNLHVAATDCTIADLTLRAPVFHNIQVHGEAGASRVRIYNVHLLDAGQQLVKVSTGTDPAGPFADDGLVACSLIEYTSHAPSDYTNGVDVLAGKGWVVRDNVLRRIRGPEGRSGPALLFWKNCQDTVVRRNLLIDCWRGIAFGLAAPDDLSRGGAGVGYDHQNGLAENNVILALTERADAAIENSYARNSRVLHNTIFTLNSAVSWSIECRYPGTTAMIKNNLANRGIENRSPGEAELVETGNVTAAKSFWFRDLEGGDFHLQVGSPAIDRGVLEAAVGEDVEGDLRPGGQLPDAGADESGSPSTCVDPLAPSAPTGLIALARDGEVELDWNRNPEPAVTGYRVYRGVASGGPFSFLASAPASAYLDAGLANGTTYHYVVTAIGADERESPFSAEASATPGGASGGPFIRGDCDGDGRVLGITDAVFLLGYNFSGTIENVPCAAACDIDGDGAFQGVITDPIYLLNHSFLGGPPPPPPYPPCGPGSASDLTLGCEAPPAACR
jgi:hypothetical protein